MARGDSTALLGRCHRAVTQDYTKLLAKEMEMEMPQFDYRWTIGNVLTIVALALQVLVLAGGGFWYASMLEARIDANTVELRTNGRIADKQFKEVMAEQKSQAQKIQAAVSDYGRTPLPIGAVENN